MLRWEEQTVEWQLRDHDMWQGIDESGRVVAQVAARWDEETRNWAWAGSYWGDRPPGLPVIALGRDPTMVGTGWRTADEAMQTVDERHVRHIGSQ